MAVAAPFLLGIAPLLADGKTRTTSWVELNAGSESEAIVDPLLGAAVPGGPFVGLSPGLELTTTLGARNSFDLSLAGSIERYVEDETRTLYGLSSWAGLTLRTAGRLYGTAAAGVEYYDDSGLDTAERAGVGARLGLGLTGNKLGAQIGATALGRQFPGLTVVDEEGVADAYEESIVAAYLSGWVAAGRRWVFQGEIDRQTTEGRGVDFDSTGWLARAGARVLLGPQWSLGGSALYQLRQFDAREPGADGDSYLQAGIRLSRSLGARHEAGLAYGYLLYTDPLEVRDESHRLNVTFTLRFGRPTTGEAYRKAAADARTEDPEVAGSRVRFRIHAPGAARVSVAGDFNGWVTGATPLDAVGSGWWETRIDLSPGSYQFVYFVDGRPMTPPRAATTIDDGFGGRNGQFTVGDESW